MDNVVDTDLGAVVQNSQSQVDIEVITASVDAAYTTALENIKNNTPVRRPLKEKTEAEKQAIAKDYYANVRTNVILDVNQMSGTLITSHSDRFFLLGCSRMYGLLRL